MLSHHELNARPKSFAAIDRFTTCLLHAEGINGGTTYTDSSPNAHAWTKPAGTVVTSTTQVKFGSTSLSFSSSGYLSGDGSYDFQFLDGDFTVEMWVYPTSMPSFSCLLDTRLASTNDANHFTFIFNNFGIASLQVNTQQVSYGSYAITINTWNHVAVVRKAFVTQIFVNGLGGGVYVVPNTFLISSGRPYIGATSSTASSPFTGYMDEIRISKCARYQGSFDPFSAPFN